MSTTDVVVGAEFRRSFREGPFLFRDDSLDKSLRLLNLWEDLADGTFSATRNSGFINRPFGLFEERFMLKILTHPRHSIAALAVILSALAPADVLALNICRGSLTQNAGDKLGFAATSTIDIEANKGMTFLTLVRTKIDPLLDLYATKGFQVANGATIAKALDNVGDKVFKGAMKDGGSKENLIALADKLNASGKMATVYTLPGIIGDMKMGGNRYGLSTFMALASGGGVAVRLDSNNIYYNVNYGEGTQPKDEMTGRSFGAGPLRDADDVSDKSLLQSIEKVVRNPNENPVEFYRAVLRVITNCDTSAWKNLSKFAQSVVTDFLAVYTAEEDRHLMSGLRRHAWDEALLEVTLLSALHSGQKEFKVMFKGFLMDEVPKQAPGGEPRDEVHKASMVDYWQFSSNPDPKSKNRSGINVTRKDFRLLGKKITEYMEAKHPELVNQVRSHFSGIEMSKNIFEDLSTYLINLKTAERLSLDNANGLSDSFAALLGQVRAEADLITSWIESQQSSRSQGQR